MNDPKTDDFRLERTGNELRATFTPTGRTYTYRLSDSGEVSEPEVSPAQVDAADYADEEIRRTATELVRLAVSGTPKI